MMRISCALVFLAFGLGMTNGTVAMAAQSKLTQEIQPIDCTNTTTDNGINVTTDTDCAGAVPPSVNSFTASDGTPIITGTFDAATMKQLRVSFLGRWYVLGQDSELTVNGNTWQLDLSRLSPPLKPGSYTVTVEVATTKNQLLRGDGILRIIAAPSSDTLVNTGASQYSYGEIAIGVMLSGVTLLILARRRKTV